MAGQAGREIVGVITIVSLLLVLSGVVLWWPDKIWRIRWAASWKRVVFDTHHALGVLAAIVLIVVTASGLFIHYQTLNRLMFRLDQAPPRRPPHQPAPPTPGAPAITADSAYRVATGVLPGARVMFLQLPPEADGAFIAAMRFPEDRTPAGRSRVFLDRFTGAPLLVTSTRQAQLGTRLGNAVRSVHTGDLLGKPTEAIWFIAVLVLASQVVSGVTMWWNGRAARRAQAQRAR
jgi:uncharacterized iron-regulated membrane protein